MSIEGGAKIRCRDKPGRESDAVQNIDKRVTHEADNANLFSGRDRPGDLTGLHSDDAGAGPLQRLVMRQTSGPTYQILIISLPCARAKATACRKMLMRSRR